MQGGRCLDGETGQGVWLRLGACASHRELIWIFRVNPPIEAQRGSWGSMAQGSRWVTAAPLCPLCPLVYTPVPPTCALTLGCAPPHLAIGP